VAVAEALQQPRRGQHRERHRRHEAGRETLRALLAEREHAAHVGHRDVDDGRGMIEAIVPIITVSSTSQR